MSYINFLLKEHLNNDLHKYLEKDRGYFLNTRQFIPYNLSANEIIDFYVNNNISKEDIIEYSREIPEFLYGNWYQTNNQRDKWQEYFSDQLKSNIQFFKECFIWCLEEHGKNSLNFLFQDKDYHQECIKKNEEIFKNLIAIGKEKNFFKDMQEKDLYTKNENYQKILKEENIISHSFSMEALKKIFNESITISSSGYRSLSIDGNAIKNFISTYIENIIDSFNKKELIIDQLELWNEGSTVKKEFLNTIINNKFNVDSDKYESFLLEVLKTPIAKKHVIDSYSGQYLPETYPKLIIPFLQTLNQQEKDVFFNTPHYSTNEYQKWLEKISTSVNKELSPQLFFSIFDYFHTEVTNAHIRKNTNNIEELLQYNKLFNVMLYTYSTDISTEDQNNIIANYLPKINYSIILNDSKEENFNSLRNLYNIMDESNQKKFKKHLNPIIQSQLYKIFYEKENNEEVNKKYYFQNIDQFNNLCKIIKYIESYEILDILNIDNKNPRWKNIVIDIHNKNIKGKEAYPFSFELIEQTNGKILAWFSNEDNLPHLNSLKFNGKNLISNLRINRNNNIIKEKHNRLIKDIIKEIAENSELFKKLIIENKSALKFVMELNDKNIQDLIFYHKLEKKIDSKIEQPLQKAKKKI